MGTVLALAEAGVLDIEQVPVIEANTHVIRRQPPDIVDNPAAVPRDDLDLSGSDGAMAALLESVDVLLANYPEPLLMVVAGDERRTLAEADSLEQIIPKEARNAEDIRAAAVHEIGHVDIKPIARPSLR